MYDKLIIYYFTGTGNALAVSNWIAGVATNQNISVEIRKITPSLSFKKEDISKNILIGFCYPTHGFNAPPIVIDFLLKFPKARNNIFLLNTRAGMKISKIFTPGLSGLAQLLPAHILKIKGYKIVGFQPMDLPSNWISVHPGLKGKVVDSIFNRCEIITQKFAGKILSGKKIYRGLISLPIDLLISPIGLAYYFYGRFVLSKAFIADSNCNNCRICENECPLNAIIQKYGRPFWTNKCESCMHCMNRCPQKAIQTPHLFVLIIWWLVFSAVPLWIARWLAHDANFFAQNFDLIFYLAMAITGLPIVFFSYRILHFLMKFRFINWLITFTSLTRFNFWRSYFAPKRYL